MHEGERVGAIQVSNGSTAVNGRAFDRAILAAGAWSSEIEVQGVPPLPRSEPVRGHLIGYRQPTETLTTIVRHGHHYFLQRANGLLIAGASVEHAGWERNIDAEIVRGLERAAARVLPHLGETTPCEVWNGFRPGAERLHMGPWHAPELLLAYGHFRNGILLAPTTADRISQSL
jgi:glycine oxidase